MWNFFKYGAKRVEKISWTESVRNKKVCITQSHGGKKYPTYNKKKKGCLD
jgi:hypothetical protein